MTKAILIFLILSIASFAHNLKSITIQLSWKNQFQFAGYLIAKHKGYYKESGLDVNIKEYDYNVSLNESVLNGTSEFAVGRTAIILDKLKGAKIVAIAAFSSQSPMVLLALKSSNIKHVKDLKNKRIMISSDAKESANVSAMLNSCGITSDDYKQIQHSFNIQDLIYKKTDAMACYSTNEPFVLQEKNVDYVVFDPKDYGFAFYDDFLFTSQNFALENPEIVEKFYEATMRGWKEAFKNINSTAQIIFENYNTQNKSLQHLIFEGNELEKISYIENFGGIQKAKLEKIINTFHVLGIENQKLDIDKFYDSFTLKIINAKYKNLNEEIVYEQVDYELVAKVTGFFGLFFVFIMAWNARLNKEIKKRKIIEEKLLSAKMSADDANFAKTKLIATIAHDIKTPMNMVIGYASMLKKSELNQKQIEYCEKILQGSQTLLSFVNDIVDFGKIESKKFEVNFEKKYLKNLFDELNNTFGFLANQKGLKLEITDNTPEIPVLCDDRKTYKILSNLLSNSIKYTQNGYVKLEGNIYKKIENFVQFEFVIEDSGIGISIEDSEHIFNMFERGTKPSKELGDGLGLFIVKQLIDELKWEINFESSEKGTTFRILTDFRKIFEAKDDEKICENLFVDNYKSKKILIIDDNMQNLALLNEMLIFFNVQIKMAQDGKKGLKIALEESFDLIITDILMPIMDGVKMTKELKSKGVSTPIVATSADFNLPKNEIIFDDFLEKPIELEKLQLILNKFL